MDFQTDIEYWAGSDGVSPVSQLIRSLPISHQRWINKRDEFFEKLTIQQLLLSKHIVHIRDVDYPLKEIRYAGSGGMNYRALCFLWKRKIVMLVMFQGSGGDGNIKKYFKTAIERAESWKIRNQ